MMLNGEKKEDGLFVSKCKHALKVWGNQQVKPTLYHVIPVTIMIEFLQISYAIDTTTRQINNVLFKLLTTPTGNKQLTFQMTILICTPKGQRKPTKGRIKSPLNAAMGLPGLNLGFTDEISRCKKMFKKAFTLARSFSHKHSF